MWPKPAEMCGCCLRPSYPSLDISDQEVATIRKVLAAIATAHSLEQALMEPCWIGSTANTGTMANAVFVQRTHAADGTRVGWRMPCGQLRLDDAKQMKGIERESALCTPAGRGGPGEPHPAGICVETLLALVARARANGDDTMWIQGREPAGVCDSLGFACDSARRLAPQPAGDGRGWWSWLGAPEPHPPGGRTGGSPLGGMVTG